MDYKQTRRTFIERWSKRLAAFGGGMAVAKMGDENAKPISLPFGIGSPEPAIDVTPFDELVPVEDVFDGVDMPFGMFDTDHDPAFDFTDRLHELTPVKIEELMIASGSSEEDAKAGAYSASSCYWYDTNTYMCQSACWTCIDCILNAGLIKYRLRRFQCNGTDTGAYFWKRVGCC